jgi:hypothetical protein
MEEQKRAETWPAPSLSSEFRRVFATQTRLRCRVEHSLGQAPQGLIAQESSLREAVAWYFLASAWNKLGNALDWI